MNGRFAEVDRTNSRFAAAERAVVPAEVATVVREVAANRG